MDRIATPAVIPRDVAESTRRMDSSDVARKGMGYFSFRAATTAKGWFSKARY
jgi:hypothetical protein